MKQIDTKEYMQDGWDSGPTGCHPYKRGSRHNKIGMWIMWIFYVIVIAQVTYAISVIPFWPITAMLCIGLLFGAYVVITAKKNGH
tara:strand:- start:813 stop:1067 length:255 start_codon:yes stop_codon:yes gene_type:complete